MRADKFYRFLIANTMPRPQIDLDLFKAEIQRRIAGGESQKDIRRWLATKDVQIHRNTLASRLAEWQGKSTPVLSTDAGLISEDVQQDMDSAADDDEDY